MLSEAGLIFVWEEKCDLVPRLFLPSDLVASSGLGRTSSDSSASWLRILHASVLSLLPTKRKKNVSGISTASLSDFLGGRVAAVHGDRRCRVIGFGRRLPLLGDFFSFLFARAQKAQKSHKTHGFDPSFGWKPLKLLLGAQNRSQCFLFP